MMSNHSRPILIIAAGSIALALLSCSDNGGPGDGGNDETPPAVSSVTAIDLSHIDVTFNESVKRATAEFLPHYILTQQLPALAPGAMASDTLQIGNASLKSDQRTVALTTATPMAAVPCNLSIVGVADLAGNSILTPIKKTFPGSTAADVTPPELVYRSPGPNATNVAISMPMGLQFSEPVTGVSLMGGC
ncbi:MAG TPA: Ig-like domain-containing protein, partial [Candidatus Krumholzibacteria bacterium]|nr:Ig-like domain-containing protein [Candidatus Krumholzibacteria bacterium]